MGFKAQPLSSPLANEIESLKARARELDSNWQGSIVKVDSKGQELRDSIKTIENFRSTGGRWHPQAANYIKNAGAQADYLEVYQFPCCGAWATLRKRKWGQIFNLDKWVDKLFVKMRCTAILMYPIQISG